MTTTRKKQFAVLVLGDLLVFIASLWLSLYARAFIIPSNVIFFDHLKAFSILFIVWFFVYFTAGLYDRYTILIRKKLPQRILTAQVFNVISATAFFYGIPFFGLTPKTLLALYLVISTLLIALWRLVIFSNISDSTRVKIVVLAEGADIDFLAQKIAGASATNSPVAIAEVVKPSEGVSALQIESILSKHGAQILAIDPNNPHIQAESSSLYGLIFKGIQFVNVQDIYEDLTDMVPLGLIDEMWFLEHASTDSSFIYDFIKRTMDVCIALPLMIVPALTYPFVWIAIKLEDGGPFFYGAERIGEGGKKMKMYKVRSMSVMDDGNQLGKHADKITRVGKFVRVTRLDEFAQLASVLKGEFSLIGPRPEFPKLVELYNKEIPHYNMRHIIKPGLSGWAQIHHEKPPHSVEETKEKLAYDLYYIKHRSLWLDLKIALQTIKTLLSRVGV